MSTEHKELSLEIKQITGQFVCTPGLEQSSVEAEVLSDTAPVHPGIGHVSCSRSRAARVRELLNILPPTANDGLDRLICMQTRKTAKILLL